MIPSIKLFQLHRHRDVSGVSGVGIVAEGIVFTTGLVAMSWLSDKHCVAMYEDIETVERIHGHDGATVVVFLPDRLAA